MSKNTTYHFDIRKKRIELGLTQETAAPFLEVSYRRYCDFELGARKLRRFEYLGVIAALVEGVENEQCK